MIKVKARELGYYGGTRRRHGDIFEIEDEDLGKEVGLWIDNKLERYDKKKK